MSVDGCGICALEAAPDASVVWRDDDWSCEIPVGLEAPGWYFLRLRRHAEGWPGLTSEEAAGFGVVSQRLDAALRAATGAPKVYFMTFGESHPHFHFLVIARPAEIDPSWRGAAIVSHAAEFRDPERALVVAGRVRDKLALVPPTP